MLFVHNYKCEFLEFHAIFDKGVRADKDLDFTIKTPLEKLGFGNMGGILGIDLGRKFFSFGSGEKSNPDFEGSESLDEFVEVLAGKNFSGRHVGNLVSGRNNIQSGCRRDQCFSRADIAFKEARHGVGLRKVLEDLLNCLTLRAGE